ncbi:hypothetical protein FB451DRAFT_1149702 [Mycena latifolia]|nr:hypothetical protein FB451DRAFT_1149702 [Mycena latifolia]
MTARFLILLPDQTPDSVQQLMFPQDPQDVPRAIALMRAVVDVGSLPESAFGVMDADKRSDLDAFILLGEIIKAILDPFTKTEMDLTDQMTSLATFAHLSFAMYREARDQYLGNQLYGDSQTMVKNAFFCLAKQQILDPTKPFYLFQVGDDPVERLFGKLRMMGGHNSSMNYSQAIDRLGHAADLQGAFMRNPDLDQAERRLNMSRAEGVDHLTMKAFTGNLIAGSCHCPAAWSRGHDRAITILHRACVDWPEDQFQKYFSTGHIDTLRPFGVDKDGNSKYPGVDTRPDRSLPPKATSAPTPSADAETQAPIQEPEDPEEEDEGDGITFEESLADTVPELELPSGPGIVPEDYILVEGKWVHKQRVCRLIISKDFEPKSTVRLLRVRGYRNVNAKPRDDTNIDPAALLGKDIFVVGDPILTLLRTDTSVSLALLRTTAIHHDGISRSSLLAATITNPAAKVKISGQIYSMELVRKTASDASDDAVTRTEAIVRGDNWLESIDDSSDWAWIWNGDYVKTDSAVQGTSEKTEKVVIVSVPGCLTELVNPVGVDASIRLGDQAAKRINSTGQSWEVDDKQLGLVCELLWGRAVENNIVPSAVHALKVSQKFPYCFADGNPALLCHTSSQQLAQERAERSERCCELCGKKAENPRAHMGMHILRKLRHIPEELAKQVDGDTPCGFCGDSSRAECAISMKVTRTSVQVQTNCRLAAPFKYAYADRGSSSTPCRNVPIICTLCPSRLTAGKAGGWQPAQWRYNMDSHLALCHPEYASPLNPSGNRRLPHDLWERMEIQRVEEVELGIPIDKLPAKFTKVAGPDEGFDAIPQQVGVRNRAPVRAIPDTRAEASTSAKRAPKRRKANSGAAIQEHAVDE